MKFTAAFILFLFPSMMFSQSNNESTDKHALEKAEIRRVAEPRPLLIFITAEWCSYCRMMKNKVFSNPEVAGKLQTDFYFAELNGEYTGPIVWQGETYRYVPNGPRTGTHELAQHLGAVNGKLTYPTLVIVDKKDRVLFRYAGFLTGKEMVALLDKLTSKRSNY